MPTSATIRAYSFLAVLLLASLFAAACASDSTPAPDGDLDSESDADLDIDGDFDLEIEERPRPTSPEDVYRPKELWRDEVEPGQIFTWGFLPRDYFPKAPTPIMSFPVVWDSENKRVLAVDPGQFVDLGEGVDYVVYALTEDRSEILGTFALPPILTDGWRWQTQPIRINSMVLIDRVLYFSFSADGVLNGVFDHVGNGIVALDLEDWTSNYIIINTGWITESDTIGKLKLTDDGQLIARYESGFYQVDTDRFERSKLPVSCGIDDDNYFTCMDTVINHSPWLDGYAFPGVNASGWVEYYGHLFMLQKSGDRFILSAMSSAQAETCIRWEENEACSDEWLSFDLGCCYSNKTINHYMDDAYVLSKTHSALYRIDPVKGGLEHLAGVVKSFSNTSLSWDGTEAKKAALGSPQGWFITDDGDVMWLSPYDYSIRGIAGPLEQWAK